MSTYYGIATDYETNEKSKRDNLTIWSGGFMSDYEGSAVSLPNGDGYMVTLEHGPKVRVVCPTPRTEANYMEVDDAIRAALTAAVKG